MGLPDFVIKPHVERKGTGVREVSDGMLVVGDRGLSIQVKSRAGSGSAPARECSWLNKKIDQAYRQAAGTARRLASKTTEMTNGRGRSVIVDGAAILWVGVVIIDHPSPPRDYVVRQPVGPFPVVVLLRRDWEFLYDQLRSTFAVIAYLHRVEGSTQHLGGEPARYYGLAADDAAAAPAEVDIDALGGGELHSVPLLPAAPAGSDDDEAHGMVRIMCEDIATSDLDDHSESTRQGVLAAIDALPVGYRTDLGRYLLDGLDAAHTVDPESTWWKLRTFRASHRETQLGFGVCSKLSELTRPAFTSWILLRHHERRDAAGLEDLTSIGVLLTPRHDGLRDWDTTMLSVTGDSELTDDEVEQFSELWNRSV